MRACGLDPQRHIGLNFKLHSNSNIQECRNSNKHIDGFQIAIPEGFQLCASLWQTKTVGKSTKHGLELVRSCQVMSTVLCIEIEKKDAPLWVMRYGVGPGGARYTAVGRVKNSYVHTWRSFGVIPIGPTPKLVKIIAWHAMGMRSQYRIEIECWGSKPKKHEESMMYLIRSCSPIMEFSFNLWKRMYRVNRSIPILSSCGCNMVVVIDVGAAHCFMWRGIKWYRCCDEQQV